MTAVRHYCTYFDHRYLPRGLALYASMRRHCEPFRLWALCLSDEAYEFLIALDLPGLLPMRLAELEAHDPELLQAKSNRTPIEYYFTCSSTLMAALFDLHPDIDVLTYLDSDLYFFASPEAIFAEFRDASTYIVPHNFSKRNEDLLWGGLYNVGWVSFRRDADGLACLAWWRKSCLEWCHDYVEGDRFGDQRYLEKFPEMFRRVAIARHPGINVAPWNLDRYRLGVDPQGAPTVDGQPIIFFHFSGLKRISAILWRTSHRRFGAPMNRQVRGLLYAPYLADLLAGEAMVQRRFANRVDPLGRGGTTDRRSRLYRTLRETVGAIVRGGGLWVVAQRLL
ncbi:MAG TPA: hypothetical protein VMC10_19055 [Stellaceae bacterium]|nr:hypothetical protein [Stellaceae bacterium]